MKLLREYDSGVSLGFFQIVIDHAVSASPWNLGYFLAWKHL